MYIIIAILILPITARNWAVLVAGSDGFYNYRHQSDVCHAYQILIKNYINPENIIVFAVDEIAYDKSNRYQGSIYNQPTWDGFPDNVYKGCNINYSKTDVNPNNFVNVLLGNKDLVPEGFPVLKTTSNDNIFIYFSDHGAPGLIAFPYTYLYENELLDTFKQMFERNLYNRIIFYLETCESGSMFVNLPNHWRIYALSAANQEESSYGIYCPPEDLVNGYRIGTCLGDEFSVSFLENLDLGNYNETLQEQYNIVQKRTKGSHVLQWGDLSFQNDLLISYFWGDFVLSKWIIKTQQPQFLLQPSITSWNSRDVKLNYLEHLFKISNSSEIYMELIKEQQERKIFDEIFESLKLAYKLSGAHYDSNNQNCLKILITQFEIACLKLSDYGLKYVRYFNEICQKQQTYEQVNKQIKMNCLTIKQHI